MTAKFDAIAKKMNPLLESLLDQRPKKLGDRKGFPRTPGVYLISDESGHLYTGRCKIIWQRLGNHGGKSPDSSTFAFKLACQAIGRKVTYKKGEGRKEIKQDQKFKNAFLSNVEMIRKMNVRFVEIEDDNTQHVFELYVHLALDTPHNDFATH
jgi:predicted GIY-YIG superfamily endonuclease